MKLGMSRLFAALIILGLAGTITFLGLSEAGVIDGPRLSGGTRESSTSTSMRRAGTSSSTTTTMSEPSSTTTAAAATTTAPSAAVPGATTTVTGLATTTTSPGGSVPDCGRGVARAVAGVTSVEGAYELTATVRNEADRAVELDTLVVRATYPGPRTANYPSDPTKFAGTRIETGQEVTFAIRESRAPEAPMSFEVAEFSYHTADLPQCKSS